MTRNMIKLLGLYILAVAGYLFFVSRFTIPVHLVVDEELYIRMARSFHYEGVFSQEGIVLDYTCVLYSMLLSLAYYAGDPQNIMFFFRAIGTVSMLSSVFPVYLLAKRMLGAGRENAKSVWGVTILTVFLPSMMSVAYCMQEVLLYPVFLWAVYFVYREIQEDKVLQISRNTILVAVFAVTGYFTKTLFLFFPVLYCVWVIWEACHKHYFHVWKKLGVFLGIWVLLYGIGKAGILWINDGIAGSDHYRAQFANLFPVDWRTILAVLSCILFYVAALLFYWAVMPVILPVLNRKIYDDQDRRFLKFIILGICILIVEIVVSVVVTEEGKVLLPHKLLYRYFQMFEVPLLLLYLKAGKRLKLPRRTWVVYVVLAAYLGLYFAVMGDQQRLAIMDAPIFLLLDNITKRFLPRFNVLACVAAATLMSTIWILYQRGKVKDFLRVIHMLGVAGIVVLFLINLFQLPYYHNQVAMGTAIQRDAVRIAEYMHESGTENVAVYYLDTRKLPYGRAVYAYFSQSVVCLTEEEIADLQGENVLVITDGNGVPGEPLELGLEVLRVGICSDNSLCPQVSQDCAEMYLRETL